MNEIILVSQMSDLFLLKKLKLVKGTPRLGERGDLAQIYPWDNLTDSVGFEHTPWREKRKGKVLPY